MNCIIRKIRQSEIQVLSVFLYKAIFIPEGATPPPREIIKQPELQIYIYPTLGSAMVIFAMLQR